MYLVISKRGHKNERIADKQVNDIPPELVLGEVATFSYDLENLADIENYQSISDVRHLSGSKSCSLSENAEFSVTINKKIGDIPEFRKLKKVKFSFSCFSEVLIKNPEVVLSIEDASGKSVAWLSQKFESKPGAWKVFNFEFDIKDVGVAAEQRLKVYVWNKGHEKFFIDDLTLALEGLISGKFHSKQFIPERNIEYDFETVFEGEDKNNYVSNISHSGKTSFRLNADNRYSPSLAKKIEEVIDILRESQQILELNSELRKKSIDLNKATEELRLANQQLRQMDEMKDEFLYTVTHEIRTPLTSIRAMAEILHDHSDMEEDQRQHFLASIIREIERLSHLITQVLNLERFENGKNRLQLVSVDLNEIVRDSMAAFSVMASETKTELVSQIPDSMHLLRCDQNLIRQVLDNLLSNAFKALPAADRKIVVSLYENQEEITVTVEDNGKGIPKELHELVFDKFFQAKNQTLKKPEGSGIGLSICKKIIELHGGKIWVVSDIEKGAKFAFTLPTLITHEEDPYS
mgnify:CR=1 FL=1